MVRPVIDVAADARESLRRSRSAEIRELEIETVDERLVLRGIVSSFYHKQLAQELVRKAVVGLEISNAVCVEYLVEHDAPDWLT